MPAPTTPKAQLRDRLLAVRRALPIEQRVAASRSVCERLLTLPEVSDARAIAAFWPTGEEVDVRWALTALLGSGRALLLPRVAGGDLALSAVADPAVDLRPGWRGVLEPSPERCDPVSVEDAEVLVLPGVAFDRAGNRLGYGGGHFDRLLERRAVGTPLVAVAFSAQVVEHVPAEPHDVPVDLIVTEHDVIRSGRATSADAG